MDWKDAVKTRFVDAIRKVLPHPTPLIGDKWFVFPPGGAAAGRPATHRPDPDFQFLGVRKLAKATGIEADRIATQIVKNLNFPERIVTVEIEEGWKINVRMTPPEETARE